MFSHEVRYVYRSNQLAEVICQLRFPEILKIAAQVPADFQDAIRDEYPRYSSRKENPLPRFQGTPGNMQLQKQEPVTNYQFASADGVWRVNLTSKFISLACSKYTRWEDFAARLDKPLVAFIRTYHPAYFERVGLRYMNFFSRKELDLEGTPYRDMFAACYLGPLMGENMNEANFSRCNVDFEAAIGHGCRAKIHAGPGLVRKNGQQDPESKFIFDQDLYMQGNIPVNTCVGALQTLHLQADTIFRGAITELTHDAMDPKRI